MAGASSGSTGESAGFSVFALAGIPEIEPGMDLGLIIGDAIAARDAGAGVLHHGDIVAVSSKIISKAEGRIVEATDREQAITDETVRVVATRVFGAKVTRIVENHLGIVGAAAGVDASNTREGTVLLLPQDPDASAAAIRVALATRFEVTVGVIITDTLGRPWREGQTDVVIGASGVTLLEDLRGTKDSQGRVLDVTAPAVGDELASAADLVKRKSAGLPVAVIRGLGNLLNADAPGARVLIRPSKDDMFRLGTNEAFREGVRSVSPATGWTVVIPVRGTAGSKSRLGASEDLARAIALDTVEAAMGAAPVIVVTSAEAAEDFAELGAEIVIDAGKGLLAACQQGIDAAGDGAVAVMLGDLPGLRSFELADVLGAAGQHARSFIPDADDEGTTIVMARNAADHRLAFGTDSKQAHLAAGYVEINRPATYGLRRDVDTQEQLVSIPRGWLGRRSQIELNSMAARERQKEVHWQ
jgi:coenzyme F420-0:L-glutamate ligase/coenzyme F420-1:gamma-L-glutamate ligase